MKRLVTVAVLALGLCLTMNTTVLRAHAGQKAADKTMTATGSVKAVSGSSLTITAAGDKDLTFTVDATTKFIGRGLSTKAKRGSITATDAVAANDQVTVAYHEMGGSMHATSVNVTRKAVAKK